MQSDLDTLKQKYLKAREYVLEHIFDIPLLDESNPEQWNQWYNALSEQVRVGLFTLIAEKLGYEPGTNDWVKGVSDLLEGNCNWEELAMIAPDGLWYVVEETRKKQREQREKENHVSETVQTPVGTKMEVGKMEMVNNQIENSRQRLLNAERVLNTLVIGHDEFVRALVLASIAGEHIVVIGPPGTAKSYAVRLFSKLVNANFYQYLLTKFTSFDEIFGTVDVVSLSSKGEFRRNWSRIVNSEFVFLDEIFKANSAILNALLSLLQERVVYDPMSGVPIQTKLHTTIGASNETPEDPEIQALYDRFTIRVFLSYLEDDKMLLNAIQARWLSSNSIQPIASMDDIRTLHNFAMSLMSSKTELGHEVYKLYHINVVPLVKNLRAKGVIVSDRTIIEKLPKLYSTYLALYGVTADNVMGACYQMVQYLARNREELQNIKRAIDESLGEVSELVKKLEKAKEYLKARNLANAKETLKELLDYDVSKLERIPWLKHRVETVMQSARQYLDYIAQIEDMLNRM
jgi:MoxR-like ATPase